MLALNPIQLNPQFTLNPENKEDSEFLRGDRPDGSVLDGAEEPGPVGDGAAEYLGNKGFRV